MRRFLIDAAITLLVLGLILVGYSYLFEKPEPAVIAQPANELKGEATTTLACKPVVIYRDKVAKELGVPDAPGRHVVAATQVSGDDHPRTVSAVYNDQSGEVIQFVRRDKLDLLSFNRVTEIGASYGYKDNAIVTRIYGRYDFMQVKAIRFALTGTIDTDKDYFFGAGMFFRW